MGVSRLSCPPLGGTLISIKDPVADTGVHIRFYGNITFPREMCFRKKVVSKLFSYRPVIAFVTIGRCRCHGCCCRRQRLGVVRHSSPPLCSYRIVSHLLAFLRTRKSSQNLHHVCRVRRWFCPVHRLSPPVTTG